MESCSISWSPGKANHFRFVLFLPATLDQNNFTKDRQKYGPKISQNHHPQFVVYLFFLLFSLQRSLQKVATKHHQNTLEAGYVRRKRSYYQWLLLGGHLHVLKVGCGWVVVGSFPCKKFDSASYWWLLENHRVVLENPSKMRPAIP